MLALAITAQDLHIRKYGSLYEGRAVSEWKACGTCGFVHQNPRPSKAALADFYARGRYHAPDVPANIDEYLTFARWYFGEKVEFAVRTMGLPAGRVFELGCGLGGALRLFQDRGWDAFGVEPDPTQATFAWQQLGLRGVRQALLDDQFTLETKVDLLFSNHAFEHIADLGSVMRAITRMLKPGGYVFTAVPTYFNNRSRLSKQWMNSSHYSLFTHRSLNQLFAGYGLEEVTHTYRGWWKEIDDLWHVARFTGNTTNSSAFYEDPRSVQRYVNLYNPLRSLLYAPVYSGYACRVALLNRITALGRSFRRSPVRFVGKAFKRCLNVLGVAK